MGSRIRVLLLALTALAGAAGTARAQTLPGTWQVTPHASYTRFDGTSAIEDGFGLGVDIMRFITDRIAVGPSVSLSRTRSDGSFFPALIWNFGTDSSRIAVVGQELSILAALGRAEVHHGFEAAPLNAFLHAGAGAYRIYLDPQSNGDGRWITEPAIEAGAGVDIELGIQTGLRIEFRDFIMTGYERDRLSLVDERFESVHFVRPDVPPARSTIHNVSLVLGFTYLP
ncbi:MAG TPA: hypothetical protein VNZ57_00705 [Longimicrobiales bacterium]|nr:hypothetical protein [Longimicrobiales bacterium]